MKKLMIICIVGLMLGRNAIGQTAKDSAMYHTGMEMLDRARTAENFLEAAFYFEQLAQEFPKQWLVYYYAGLAYIQASQKALDSNYKDELIDKAQIMIDKVHLLRPNEPEFFVLQAFLYQARLLVNPQVRGLAYSQKADTYLQKALAADPANPRAYFLLGCNVYYTPAMFKGGAKNALPVFVKARKLFLSQVTGLPFDPQWGYSENEAMIKTCNASKN
jgi:tetratricopeptide (TPR) repeat protein